MSLQMKNQFGLVTIEDRVIANIASAATLETYGIVGLAARNTKDGIYELLKLENATKGVCVESTGPNSMIIQLHVIMEYGIRIAIVAQNVIEKVKYSVESQTGLIVDSVDLIVQGLRF